jgi:hypothetical protein
MFSSAKILKPDVPPPRHTFLFDGVNYRLILTVSGIAGAGGLAAWLLLTI